MKTPTHPSQTESQQRTTCAAGFRIDSRSTLLNDRMKFIDPSPHDIEISGKSLKDHLMDCGARDVFVIRRLLAEQDWSGFEAHYKPGGRPPYAPRALVGLILYGLLRGQSSLRELEALAGRDLGCWWLTGGLIPDHSVIGRFMYLHSDLLTKDFFVGLTSSVLKFTKSTVDRTAGDGTVVEAAASRFCLVKEEALAKQLAAAKESVAAATDEKSAMAALNKQIRLEKAQSKLKERAAKRAEKGKDAEKTQINTQELDAVLQPLKNQGYGTSYKPSVVANSARVIVAHAVDASCETVVVPALLDMAGQQGTLVESCWDAGYHCDGVLDAADQRTINLLTPEGCTSSEGWNKQSDKQYPKSHFDYDPETNTYRCPAGELLKPVGSYKGNAIHKGYVEYGTPACAQCPQREKCTKSPTGRQIKRYAGDPRKEALRLQLQDEAVQKRYRQRAGWVEPVFSALKGKQRLTRFRRKGLASVRLEFALHALAYNLGRAIALSFAIKALMKRLRTPKIALIKQNCLCGVKWA